MARILRYVPEPVDAHPRQIGWQTTIPHVAALVMTMSMMVAGEASAQALARLDEQSRLIVRLEPTKGFPGSGLIIAVENDIVRILTARHVIEAGATIPDVATAAGENAMHRPCSGSNMPVRVVFEFPRGAVGESPEAQCSDRLDAAIIEVRKPSGFDDSIPPFSAHRSLSDQPGSKVFLTGMAQGANLTLLSGTVKSKSPEYLQVLGVGIGPGYSGGAVFDGAFGFIGLIVAAGDTVVSVVPAFLLTQMLETWGVRAPKLKGASTQPDNPHFAGAPTVDNENGRNALRRYRGAFVSMDEALVREAYPSSGTDPLRLFGDASKTELELKNCSDIDPYGNPRVTAITCAYNLNVTRKTGPVFHASTCDYAAASGVSGPGRMVFELKEWKDDPFGWKIEKITVTDTAPCQADVKPK
jgi:hypothetical protein